MTNNAEAIVHSILENMDCAVEVMYFTDRANTAFENEGLANLSIAIGILLRDAGASSDQKKAASLMIKRYEEEHM